MLDRLFYKFAAILAGKDRGEGGGVNYELQKYIPGCKKRRRLDTPSWRFKNENHRELGRVCEEGQEAADVS